MNEIKFKFLQNAPTFVTFGGIGSLVFFVFLGVLAGLQGNWGSGSYVIVLCGSALIFIYWTIRRFERNSGKSFKSLIEKDKKAWAKYLKEEDSE